MNNTGSTRNPGSTSTLSKTRQVVHVIQVA